MSALGNLSKKLNAKVATIAGLALLVGALVAPVPAEAVVISTIACSISGSVTIQDAVVTSGHDCAGSASIPSGITTIGNSAFGANQTLTSISLPATVTTIRNSAFGAAGSLRSISFAGDAPTLENSAFGGVSVDTKAYITASATGFGTGTWNGLTLALQPNAAGNGQVPCSVSGFVTVVSHVATGNTSCAGALTLPSEVTRIGGEAFINNITLTSLSMPSVTTVDPAAFHSNSALTSVSMPLVTSLGPFAFWGNTALTTVNMPSVTTIGFGAFSRATSLTTVNIPSATTIGTGAFWSNTALTSVSMPAIVSIGEIAFENSSALVRVEFAGNAPTVGPNVFSGAASGATAYISYPATGFGTETTWQGLLISRAAAPYVEPIVVAEVPTITVTGITGEGASRVITGTLLSSVTSVVVQGSPVSFSAQSDNSMSFAVPNLPAGRYDILIGGTSGNLIWQEGLVLKAAPILAKISNLNIEGFKARSAKLTTPMKVTIKRVVAGFGAKSLTCAPGASSSKLAATQQKLAIARAKAVCSYAASLAPKAKSNINPRVFKRAGAKDSFVRISLIG